MGQAFTVAVSVAPVAPGTGTPTGTVTVSDGTDATCPATLSSGVGSCQLTPTTAGLKQVTATRIPTSRRTRKMQEALIRVVLR